MAAKLPMAAEAEPPFPHVAIVGYGLIGASLGKALRARWPKTIVIAIDRKDVIETAMRTYAADVGGDDLGLASGAELIVLAAPARANLDILAALPDFVPGEALITDVGSTKRQIVEAARALPPRLTFVGGHPLAGAAVSGIEAAREDLFAGRPWLLTRRSEADEEATTRRHEGREGREENEGGGGHEGREKHEGNEEHEGSEEHQGTEEQEGEETVAITSLIALITALGARPVRIDAEAHDRLLALISHLPQFTASALMQVIGERAGADGLLLAGRGLRDTTRLAASPGDIWRDIAATNSDHIGAALDAMIDTLKTLRAGLNDGAQIEGLFNSARAWKQVLESSER